MQWRDQVCDNDRHAVRQLVTATGFFSPGEQDIAVELVDDALTQGEAAGYEFLFADNEERPGMLRGYACFGPVPSRPRDYDLYWIAVAPSGQRHGLGRQLIAEAERRAVSRGAVSMSIDTSGREQYLPTRAFYARMGYRIHEVVRDFYATGDDKVVYRKQLCTTPS
jgi:ribosomal protein S18 acetylase RimI-like enzyme